MKEIIIIVQGKKLLIAKWLWKSPPCTSHKTETMGYLEWHAWAEERVKKGDKQKQCPKCKRWFFEDYF
jgi:hypothetical protein